MKNVVLFFCFFSSTAACSYNNLLVDLRDLNTAYESWFMPIIMLSDETALYHFICGYEQQVNVIVSAFQL